MASTVDECSDSYEWTIGSTTRPIDGGLAYNAESSQLIGWVTSRANSFVGMDAYSACCTRYPLFTIGADSDEKVQCGSRWEHGVPLSVFPATKKQEVFGPAGGMGLLLPVSS